ncbi:E1 protein [Bos taurus papillomavirus 16]|uniref:Replication protein E1 n=1 Tax=Bos taurus papillomavirus 16 TaxID=1887214 RepID=A0A1B2K253_9PAPI|nr:E1 protein [Bos taurus papillomavirus 16]ANZ90232.1 E1 protein [Bos taurus papillomavirus 16]
MAEQGTSGEWFMVREADCSDMEESFEELSTESDISDLIDNGQVCQGNSMQLFHLQESEEHEATVSLLKRKHLQSPKEKVDCDLSPRLKAITISPEKHAPKRRLFQGPNDSGLDLETQYEAETVHEEGTPQVTLSDASETLESPLRGQGEGTTSQLAVELLKSSNRRAVQCARFKTIVGVSFTEITRNFKSDKTCAGHWVAGVFDALEANYDAALTVLKPCCLYYNISRHLADRGSVSLFLMSFQVNKSRETVTKLLKNILQVDDVQIMCDPPRLRSGLTALFWFRLSFSSISTTYGETPDWIRRQTVVGHQTADAMTFKMAEMVQWAYDNGHTDEPTVAYEYAKLADENSNANAWLCCNNQARYVKECVQMVKLYKNAEMGRMTMSAWIHHRCKQFGDKGDWRAICDFLRYQNVEIPMFWNSLKNFFKRVPKKTCIVFHGPCNTGKSMFCLSFIRFMGGTILSFHNSRSQFWLSPLTQAKVAMIDDATHACWEYIDKYLRNGLDGNELCIDVKHRHPVQIRCPPLIITTNIDLTASEKWHYLASRVVLINFPNIMPMTEEGAPMYLITALNWKFLFQRLWQHLDFSDQEDEGDGDPASPFRCTARTAADSV